MTDELRSDLRAIISAHIRDTGGLVPDELGPETRLEFLDLDSLDMVEMVMTIEDRWGLDLGESWEPWKTVGDIYFTVEEALKP